MRADLYPRPQMPRPPQLGTEVALRTRGAAGPMAILAPTLPRQASSWALLARRPSWGGSGQAYVVAGSVLAPWFSHLEAKERRSAFL